MTDRASRRAGRFPHLGRNFPQQWLDGEVERLRRSPNARVRGEPALAGRRVPHHPPGGEVLSACSCSYPSSRSNLSKLLLPASAYPPPWQYLLVGLGLWLFYLPAPFHCREAHWLSFGRLTHCQCRRGPGNRRIMLRAAFGSDARAVDDCGMLVALYAIPVRLAARCRTTRCWWLPGASFLVVASADVAPHARSTGTGVAAAPHRRTDSHSAPGPSAP